jgi:hypothetical protein
MRWHGNIACHLFFKKTSDGRKAACPPFFADNPDAMEAFKKHGVANIK